MEILAPRVASTAAGNEVYGGATMMSHEAVLATNGLNVSKNARVSPCVLNIFQFPAMTGLRKDSPAAAYAACNRLGPSNLFRLALRRPEAFRPPEIPATRPR